MELSHSDLEFGIDFITFHYGIDVFVPCLFCFDEPV